MKRLSRETRTLILRCFTEGVGVNATARMADVSKNTVLKLLADLSPVCEAFQDRTLRGLKSRRIQLDEIWAFCGMKAVNVPVERKGEWGIGDVWTWTAIDADTKLVPSWLVGTRDAGAAHTFVEDLASRLTHRVQLTTDGNSVYLDAVYDAFGGEVDYSMLVKLYGAEPEGARRYSPAKCIGARKSKIIGAPDMAHASTSYVERLNLEIRTKNRRYTRLTNGFSRKVANLEHSLNVGFMVYNFVRVHGSLRVSPAMQAGVADHLWTYEEVVGLLEAAEPSAVEVGATRKDRRISN